MMTMRSDSTSSSLLLIRALAAGLLVAVACAGCQRGEGDGNGGSDGARAERRCQASTTLPGSMPLPPAIVHSIAGTSIPAQALLRKRRVCNRLALEPDAFARQHALDAIDWRTWSPSALAEAAALRRPLFVLTGFSTCASCRDLSIGPLADRRLARAINRNFVPVLVDREERPDVDAYLMQAVQVLTGGAGWPSVVFLQPDLRPFQAHSWGAAGVATANAEKPLARIVEEVRRRISLGGGTIEERAELTAEKMQRRATVDTSGPLPEAAVVAASLRGYLAESFDAQAGSFGPAPLFPRAPVLEFLSGLDAEALEMAIVSLERLRVSPMADADGGFRRYARQAAWQEPVSEKMLADNAALASAYLAAAQRTGRADLREAARAIVDFLLRDLALGDGAFAASIDRAAPAGARARDGNQADARVADADGAVDPKAELRDDIVLADANALAISALVRAARVLGQPRYLDAAVAAGKYIDTHLRDGGRVLHCLHAGGIRCVDGYLSDHALAALAFLDLDEAGATGGSNWLDAARAIADAMPGRFGHQAGGGFFLAAEDAAPLPLRLKPALDGAVPCGNSAAARLYVRLAQRTGEARYRDEARRTFEAFAEVLALRPLALPAMVAALSLSSAPPRLEPAPALTP